MIEQMFKNVFGYAPAASGFTPGRVNLIGEHTDYNGGMVLPTALAQGLSIAVSARGDNLVRMTSDKFEGLGTRELTSTAQGDWSDYILGAVKYAVQAGFITGGADVAVQTTLPFGAGLSSSAALTVGILKLFRNLAGRDVSDKDIAVLARRIENEFIGVPCGIMDQIAVAIAHPGQALALDTRTLDYKLIELPATHKMAVVHSGIYRQLNEGRYAERKEECDLIKARLGHENICLATDEELLALGDMPEHILRRARHCVSEQARTHGAIAALENGDITKFGAILNAAHVSIRDDFEITTDGIDALVESAVQLGALGARQTGGGFGGCIVACVENDMYEHWLKNLLAANPEAFDVLGPAT